MGRFGGSNYKKKSRKLYVKLFDLKTVYKR